MVSRSTQSTVGEDGGWKIDCEKQSPVSKGDWCVLQLTRRRTGLLVRTREVAQLSHSR
jgi:hypothetical protein